MHGAPDWAGKFREMAAHLASETLAHCDVMLCPPAPLIAPLADVFDGTPVGVGGQDCHVDPFGPHTGDISAEMLADAGASAVILGHSERRTDHGEDDALVRQKVEAAARAKLAAIVCVGETESERKAGDALKVLSRQIEGSLPAKLPDVEVIVAYEPVWAIGTGLTATPDDVAEAHAHIRAALAGRFKEEGEKVRLLYGGSVKPGNAESLFSVPNVDGGLIGGASLKPADFRAIVEAMAHAGVTLGAVQHTPGEAG
jgi:triosephosphate isomerase